MTERAPYMPANGTEGAAFEARFCDRCAVDRAFRDELANADGSPAEPCPIVTGAYWGKGPEEWREDGPSGPRCTAFELAPGEAFPLDPGAVVRPLL